MVIIAGVPVLLWTALAVAAPTLIALFWPAFRFASTPRQRIANLLCGLAFVVAAMYAVASGLDPQPNSWTDKNFGLFVIGIAPFGAALGVAIAVASRHFAARRTTSHDPDPFSETRKRGR